MTSAAAVDFNRAFQALSDPYRRGFIERLSRGPASVTELAAPTDVGLPAVLKHLRILEESGIVVSEKVGRVRTFQMRPDGLQLVDRWIAQRQAEMNTAFDGLAALMMEVPERENH